MNGLKLSERIDSSRDVIDLGWENSVHLRVLMLSAVMTYSKYKSHLYKFRLQRWFEGLRFYVSPNLWVWGWLVVENNCMTPRDNLAVYYIIQAIKWVLLVALEKLVVCDPVVCFQDNCHVYLVGLSCIASYCLWPIYQSVVWDCFLIVFRYLLLYSYWDMFPMLP